VSPLCSRNARSRTPLVGRAQWGTHPGHPRATYTSELEGWEGQTCWSCAPGTEEGMEPDDLLCSRNARPGFRCETRLVGLVYLVCLVGRTGTHTRKTG
jgi:hypothetical protein